MSKFTESVIEQAFLGWLESLDYHVKYGRQIVMGVAHKIMRYCAYF